MCGIVGYIGYRPVMSILLNGLERLEYRGYDSSGIAVIQNNSLCIQKKKGKIRMLKQQIHGESGSTVGIGHTRWATHGVPSDANAHPHTDCTGRIAIVHNGIIENYSVLKKKLMSEGHRFLSDTDTEVLCHLIEKCHTTDLVSALRKALQMVEGTFGVLVLSSLEPDRILAARRGSPLLIGIGEGETCLASDGSAIVEHTRNVIYLDDDEMAVVERENVQVRTLEDRRISKSVDELPYDMSYLQKNGHPHFMLKEICEQPETTMETCRGRLLVKEGTAKLGGLEGYWDRIRSSSRLILTACGTSWHAALIGEYLIEKMARLPVEVEYASEFRYRDPIISQDDTILAISQSGETADTLAAIVEAKSKNALVLGLCNSVGSTIARETHAGVYLHAGPEIGVASTKAFTSQVMALALIALVLGRMGPVSAADGKQFAQELSLIPGKIQKVLEQKERIESIAHKMVRHRNALYLGRGFNYPVALEGALKMKEISYIHAEGYPAAEMKHGPIALIDDNMPVVIMATQDPVYDKVLSNIEEISARGGHIIAIVNEGDVRVKEKVENVIEIPVTVPCLMPLLTVIPLQILAYYTAVLKGCDVDQPRNLAKSVTVE